MVQMTDQYVSLLKYGACTPRLPMPPWEIAYIYRMKTKVNVVSTILLWPLSWIIIFKIFLTCRVRLELNIG